MSFFIPRNEDDLYLFGKPKNEKDRQSSYDCGYQQDKADGFQEALTSNGIKLYVDKIKADGARKFLVWYSGGETMPSFGRYAKCNIDDVIAEWQKGI